MAATNEEPAGVPVVYVASRDAKLVKTALEGAGLLDPHHRMVPAARGEIAVPVVGRFFEHERTGAPWSDRILRSGFQECPSSTRTGNLRRRKGQAPSSSSMGLRTPLQQALLDAVLVGGSPDPDAAAALLENAASLGTTVWPKKLATMGDDRTLVLPPGAFEGDGFRALLRVSASNDDDGDDQTRMEVFWEQLAAAHGSHRIVRKGGVDPNSGIRESGHRLVFPDTGIPEATGPGSPGWIRVTEQGIRQSFDLTRVMFSRGNVSEKIRFGKLVREGEEVLDLYAGIGYYTLPAVVHGHAKRVVACEWNKHALRALRHNLADNRVEDRVTVLEGDCRASAARHGLVDGFDRVSLGLLPSSEGGWETAVRALRNATGGWLHVHANVPNAEKDAWALWLCHRLLGHCHANGKPPGWVVLCKHVERVKSFAPTVGHYVADVFVGAPGDFPEPSHANDRSGIFRGGSFVPCPDEIAAPSCALSPDGVLSQAWMR